MSLLLAVALILSEQSYGPYARPLNGSEAVAAASRTGVLLAWSEAGRIRVGTLDPRGRLSRDPGALPARSARSTAVAPVVASDGDSYFVAWVELEGGLQRTIGMQVDRRGTPVGTPRQYGRALDITANAFAVPVVWDGSVYHLWGGGARSRVAANGDILAAVDIADVPSGVAAGDGVVATTSSRVSLLTCGFSWCSWESRVSWTIGAKSDFLRIGLFTGSAARGHDLTPSPTGIAAAGNRFVITWPSRAGIVYHLIGDGTNSVHASPDPSVRPGLACDATDCVIAYSQSNDVYAFAWAVDRLSGVQLLTLAASERVERAPRVHTLGEGKLLVTWRSDGSDGARLHWRILLTEPLRRRAVR